MVAEVAKVVVADSDPTSGSHLPTIRLLRWSMSRFVYQAFSSLLFLPARSCPHARFPRAFPTCGTVERLPSPTGHSCLAIIFVLRAADGRRVRPPLLSTFFQRKPYILQESVCRHRRHPFLQTSAQPDEAVLDGAIRDVL